MTLLITGALGHVGTALVESAAARGMSVLAVHRAARTPAPVAGPGTVTWRACDLDDAAAVAELADAYDIDACIHAAAVSNEAFARPAPLAAITTNVAATAHLLDAARRRRWRRVVVVSTGSVFQKRADIVAPILEDAVPEPANIYATTKTAAEMLTRMYRSEFGLSASAVRISWVFGPPVVTDAPTRGPIPSFLMRGLKGDAIREGGADFAASFTYIDDVVDGLLAAVSAPTLSHAVYHLGHGRNFTAGEVAAAVRAAIPSASIELAGGTEPWTRYTAMRAPLAGRRLLDDTGFAPRIGLAAAIQRYADWMRTNAHLRA